MIIAKKKITLLLAMLLILGAACPSFALADGTEGTVLTIHTPAVLPAVGESFTVTVDISGNPGLCAVQFTLTYDEGAMECTAAALGPVLKGTLAATNPRASKGAMVAAASAEPVEGDGTLAKFTFQMLKPAETGAFAVSELLLTDGEGNAVSAGIVSDEAAAPSGGSGEEEPAEEQQPTAGQQETAESVETAERVVRFTDVDADYWGAPYIAKAAELGLFSGDPDGNFRPEANISRAEFVTVLWRTAGSPEPQGASGFADVPADEYYAKAVAWATENGCVNGVSAECFDPEGVLERQAAMSILFRYSGSRSGMELLFTDAYDSGFADSGEIADWAKPAMYWAYYNGIISGVGESCLSPTTGATRAQIAKILVNYQGKFPA